MKRRFDFLLIYTAQRDAVFRCNAGSDCVSECGAASNDDDAAGDDMAVAKRQQTSSDVTRDTGHLVRHQIPPPASAATAAVAASSSGRRHDYHQLPIGSYDTRCYASNDAVSPSAVASYLPGTPLSCISPYFATTTRANVFHTNHSLDTSGGLYSMQLA